MIIMKPYRFSDLVDADIPSSQSCVTVSLEGLLPNMVLVCDGCIMINMSYRYSTWPHSQ